MTARMRIGAAVVGGALLTGGCQLVAGVQDVVPYPADGGSSGQGGGTTTTATTGVGGETGGTGGSACVPGSAVDCMYSGAAATKDVGTCHAGKKVCAKDGSGYGECLGEVTPQAESCAAAEDEDCDGYDCVKWAELFGDA